MSTELMTYVNFAASLIPPDSKGADFYDNAIKDIIAERDAFIKMGRSNMEDQAGPAIDKVFDHIDDLAKTLEEEQIAEESVKIAEDAAAVAGIWSFGLSMAAFAIASVADMVLQQFIKAKEEELNKALASCDHDIADKMGGAVGDYIRLTKKNNNFFKTLAVTGLSPQTERSYIYNMMDFLDSTTLKTLQGGVTLENFKRLAHVARMTMNDPNINNIYNALDMFVLNGDHGQQGVQDALKNINASGLAEQQYIVLARTFTYVIMLQKMSVSKATLKLATESMPAGEGVPPEEASFRVFKNMDNIGKAMAGFTIVLSLVDAGMNIYNIVETVKRYEANVQHFKESRQQYKDFYQHMFEASAKYQPKQTEPDKPFYTSAVL